MIFVKVIIGVLLYLAFGVGLTVLMCRLDESFDYEVDDTLMTFVFSLIWPFMLMVLCFKVFTEKLAKFFSDFLDRIETIKEERKMEDEE